MDGKRDAGTSVKDPGARARGDEERADYFLPDSLRPLVGSLLREWRERAGKSQRDVQTELNKAFTASYLSQLENGLVPSPRIETFIQLALHYGVSLYEVWNRLFDIVALSTTDDAQATQDVRRAAEIDRAFEFISMSPDFPTPEFRVPQEALRGLSPDQKVVMIVLYQRATGLSVLPRWILDRFEAAGGEKEADQPSKEEVKE